MDSKCVREQAPRADENHRTRTFASLPFATTLTRLAFMERFFMLDLAFMARLAFIEAFFMDLAIVV